jgi:hypothetical protein
VIIVVPARLRQKWRLELRSRFDESFELAGTPQLRELLQGWARGNDPGDLNWIVSYETLRRRSVCDELERLQPPLDLVILDEAHRVRNTSTLQHAVSRVLADCAEALVFLTATPVQTGQEDLFNLLRLLEPGSFADRDLFSRQLEAQLPIVNLLRLIRAGGATARDFDEPIAALRASPMTRPFTEESFFASIEERCRGIASASRTERVALERDVAELSLTGHIFTRSKKRDVTPNCPPRTPQAVTLTLSRPERAVYGAVEALCNRLGTRSFGWGAQMSMLMAYRYTASCVPAAVEYFASRLGLNPEDLARSIFEETEDEGAWNESERVIPDEGADPTGNAEVQETLARLVRETSLGSLPDTKFSEFLRVLQEIWDEDEKAGRRRRKVVVFSFFKRTLSYIRRKLDGAKIGCALITGDVPFTEREDVIDAFRREDGIRVLLSSEVGSEGLDLQFASVVVNYDLPWNPMVVEQRIGRLDRIGQQAERIVVVNFAIKDTVEDRILLRLYQRIGIFEASIGDLDPILGARIEELALDALSGRLTDDEQAAQVNETAQAIARQVAEAGSLGGAAEILMAADQAFLDEINSLADGRRIPSATELAHLLRGFLAERYPGTVLPAGIESAPVRLALPDRLAGDLIAALKGTSDATAFAAHIRGGPFEASLDAESALRQRRTELLHRRHPLVRFMQDELARRQTERPRAFAVRLRGIDLPDADYVFAIMRFNIRGNRPRNELMLFIAALGSEEPVKTEDAEQTLFAILDGSEDLPVAPDLLAQGLHRAHRVLEREAEAGRARLFQRESNLAAARAARDRTSRLNLLQNQVETAQRQLQNLVAAHAVEFPQRMARLRLEKAQRELHSFETHPPADSKIKVEREEIAMGFLRVAPEATK